MRKALVGLSFALAGLAACTGIGREPVRIESVVVFGDSLSDVGTYRVATRSRSNPGKFNVNPHPIWVDTVAAHYGLALEPDRSLTMDTTASSGATTAVGTAKVIGGNGYAEGGARVARLPSQSGVGNNRLVAPVAQQVERFLATNGSFAPGQLVLVDGGTNDVYAQFSALCYGTDDNGLGGGNTTQEIADAEIERAANDLVALVRRMTESGAGTVLVAGAFDWSRAPFGLEYLTESALASCGKPVAAGQVSDWTATFNRIASRGVSRLPGVVFLDFDAPIAAMLDDPARYGIANVTEPACTNTEPTKSAIFCTTATMAVPDADRTYLWSDTFHPGPTLHRTIAERALSLLAGIATR